MRALQQQVNALMSQNAALEAQLVGQQNIAQGLAELAWSNHDRAESFTSTDEEDACRSERLGKAASVLRQRRTLLCVDQEGRELCVWCVSKCAWSFDVCSGIARRGHSSNSCNWRA